MDVLQRHLGHGHVEPVAQLVAQALHHHPLVFERLREFDVKLEEGGDDEHFDTAGLEAALHVGQLSACQAGVSRPVNLYASAGSSFSTLNASITSPTLMSW